MTDGQVMEEQAGFRNGRGCEEQIFVMRQLAEKMTEKDRKMYPVFVDLEKAYDKVCREELCMGMLTEIWCVRSSTESHKDNVCIRQVWRV